ncbi:WD and tetratricopeptide repeats protein 1 [Tetrabaena socialis]|uniref:WD and tetratricopeptide repeats protein 1 n=1 Tax=Tetrabaena socialis TaxID=47790 RepID=A0A2J8A454_9CHLO|nr:WD and tetratricopeptide repeats protein 1 [Tetrabaena socialis]|eukprot:PNH07294.1 WD and tetratricopeptide repeats protein 1 [Tetrabaena socialis]
MWHVAQHGHTGSILAARFLTGSGGSKLVCCSTDRQVRLVDLHKQAARPFLCHRARVKALAVVSPDTFLSASEDGTVRLFDVRQASSSRPSGSAAPWSGDAQSLLVEQRCERAGRSSLRISINSLAVSPLEPHLFATGGGDPFARLYDMRMLRTPHEQASPATGITGARPSWVSCYAPHHLCTPSLAAGAPTGFSTLGRVRHLTGVTFAAGGRHLLLSYSGEAVYAMCTRAHAMSYERLERRLKQHLPAAAAGSGAASAAAVGERSAAPAAWEFYSPPRRAAAAAAGRAAQAGAGGGTASAGGERAARLASRARFLNWSPAEAADVNQAAGAAALGGARSEGAAAAAGNAVHPYDLSGDVAMCAGGSDAAAAAGGSRHEEQEPSDGGYVRRFDGHKNIMTIKEVAWIGGAGFGPSYVASGSDDGHVFVWDYDTGEVVRMMAAQEHVIPTCLSVNPLEPMLAACGNGTVVRLWAPGGEPAARGASALSEEQRALAAANRVDLQRRQVEAELAARARPVGTGWASFAAAIRGRTDDLTAAVAVAATTLSAAAAAQRAEPRTPPRARARAASPASRAAALQPQQQPQPQEDADHPQERPLGEGMPPSQRAVLRLSTALERQQRRTGSPEETIPAFSPPPGVRPRGLLAGGRALAGEAAPGWGEGDREEGHLGEEEAGGEEGDAGEVEGRGSGPASTWRRGRGRAHFGTVLLAVPPVM